MAEFRGVQDTLNIFHRQLLATQMGWERWSGVEVWIASFRPFLRQHFPTHVSDFSEVARTPDWHKTFRQSELKADPSLRQAHAEALRANDGLARAARLKLLSYVDTLLKLSKELASQPRQ